MAASSSRSTSLGVLPSLLTAALALIGGALDLYHGPPNLPSIPYACQGDCGLLVVAAPRETGCDSDAARVLVAPRPAKRGHATSAERALTFVFENETSGAALHGRDDGGLSFGGFENCTDIEPGT